MPVGAGVVRLELLGPVELRCDDELVADRAWRGRERVRQLIAFLANGSPVSRRVVAAALWPDLDDVRAAANLRVNLNHLRRVLAAAGVPDALIVDGVMLGLDAEVLDTDVDAFERGLDRARRLDGAGRAIDATDEYVDALAMVRGRYLEDCDDRGWAELERLRLHALVTGASCRLAELWLERGEPEQAAAHAALVLAGEPCQERAGRLLARSVAAQGDRPTARGVLAELLRRVAALGLTPEPATARLAAAFAVTA